MEVSYQAHFSQAIKLATTIESTVSNSGLITKIFYLTHLPLQRNFLNDFISGVAVKSAVGKLLISFNPLTNFYKLANTSQHWPGAQHDQRHKNRNLNVTTVNAHFWKKKYAHLNVQI